MSRLAAMFATVILGAAPAAALPDSPITNAGPAGKQAPIRLAQIQLNFGGGSDAAILRSLRRNGYSEIEIYYRGLTKSRVRACRVGERFQMEVTPNGRVKNSSKIGECRSRITLDQARDKLRNKGYRKIFLEGNGHGGFRGTACMRNRRMDMIVGPFGKIREVGQLGRCQQILTRKEVAQRLRAKGYNRIKIAKDTPPPPFFAEACKNLNRVDLTIVGNGRIMRERRVGRCEPPINPNQIAAVLERQGFSRVRVTDDVLPGYGATACRGNDRFELVLNRFGVIRDQRRIGECPKPLTREQVVKLLREEGFTRIAIQQDSRRGFIVEGCLSKERLRIALSPFGKTLSEKVVGRCQSPRIGKILRDYEKRGFSRTRVFIEGCRKGRRIRIELNDFGDQVARRQIGRCR